MRQLKKTIANVANAELYVLEKKGKNGRTLYGVTCVSEYSFDRNRPYHSGCATEGQSYYFMNIALEKAIEDSDKSHSSNKTCAYVLYINNKYYGKYSTAYHASGSCLNH